ncbi:TPA: acyltransferase family protein [Vibrio antiquarius]
MKNRIVHLDAMRGIAILLVLLFHTYGRWPGHLSFVNESSDILVVKYGYLGVNLFFVISGYVILMTLDKKNSLIEFYISRWLRLFPLMFLCSLLIYSSSFF